MRIPVEFDDETIILIDEIAAISGMSRVEVVENALRKAVAKDSKRIKNKQPKEEKLESEN